MSTETDTKSIDDPSTQHLWSFIKSTKATQSASLKSLQKFILSLNKKELIHLIESYLKSKLSKYNAFSLDSLTIKQTYEKLLDSKPQNKTQTVAEIDDDILNKLNEKYGNKYNKKTMKSIQQNKSNNLLSIHPQVLAYSFQFLSYKQLCKTQSVCVYFTYLNKQYPGLTHYYIKLNRSFFAKTMRYKISLNNLSMFKYIEINVAYATENRWSKDSQRRSQLFKYILKTIIKQSISNLDMIKINTDYAMIYDVNESPPFNVLLFIMNEFNTLPISKLIWRNDLFKPSKDTTILNILEEIRSKIKTSFPKLKQFIFKMNRFPGLPSTRSITIPSLPVLSRFVITPVINSYFNQLESLNLDGRIDYFNKTPELIKLIAENMTNLKKLSIISIVSNHFEAKDINNIKPSISLQELKLQLNTGPTLISSESKKSMENILSYLFSIFIGISKFEFNRGYYGRITYICIGWKELFDLLINSKQIYSINNGQQLLPLESLIFHCWLIEQTQHVLKELLTLRNMNLKHFEIETCELTKHAQYVAMIKDYLIPFFQLYHNGCSKLKSMKVNFTNSSKIEESYFEPFLNLLDNIPPSIISMKFELPLYYLDYQIGYKRDKTIKEKQSKKLVNKLCEMSFNKNKDSKLETLRFDTMRLAADARKYLIFFFGFNNNIFMDGEQYCLVF